MFKKTKILATIGPASDSEEMMSAMVKAGCNAFRMNFSHGTHEYHEANLNKIRAVEKSLGVRVGVFQDISGPKIRVGKLEENFKLKTGDKITFLPREIIGKKSAEGEYELSINHPEILPLMKAGEFIYLYDGSIRAKVVAVSEQGVRAVLENDGFLSSNKGVNFPNTRLNIDVITQKDLEDLRWGAAHGVNFVGISFVQSQNDILRVREILNSLGSKAKIYAKIEKFDAVENIEQIIEASDGIMVARGDLGIEMPFYEIPRIQKRIIALANARSKPVITATQMMLSMTEHERATRAEISDVANAVLDGTDAVMLSEESAIGKNPAAVVAAMSETIRETEKIYPYDKFNDYDFYDETDMITSSTAALAARLGAGAILSITGSGRSAIKLARNRAKIDIIAIAHDEQTAHALSLVWGVNPAMVKEKTSINSLLARIISEALQRGLIEEDGTYVMTAGFQSGHPGSTDYIRIIKKDQIDFYRDAAETGFNGKI